MQIHKEELVEQAEGKEKESEFWITAEGGDEHKLSFGWIEGEKMGGHSCENSGDRGLKLIDDK